MLIREFLHLAKRYRHEADGFDLVSQAGAPVAKIFTGLGTPEAVVTAPPGSLFLRQDGAATTTLYVKTSGTGNTGWTAK